MNTNHITKARDSILKLSSVYRLKQQLVRRKIPEAQSSATIIIQQFLKHLDNERQNRRRSVMLKIIKALKMRLYHYPIQYLVPFWYFRFLTIKIVPPLLVPRFETEYFVSLMIQKIIKKYPKGSTLKMVDFCCGSGVIGLSLLKQLRQIYKVEMTFLDLSTVATKYTKINCDLNSMSEDSYRIIEGNMLNYLSIIKESQVVISNPPYLPEKKYRTLQKQIRIFQDKDALVSGQNGMDLIEPLVDAIISGIKNRKDLIAGIEYDGQQVEYLGLQNQVCNDQYCKRRYLIFQ